MKKKHVLFLTISALSLTGCGFPIDNETALQRLDEIEKHEFKDEEVKALTIKQKYESYTEEIFNDVNSKSINSYNANIEGKINYKKYFLYMHVDTEGINKTTGEESKYTIELDIWYYLKDNKFYMPFRYNLNGSVSMLYTVDENVEDAKKNFNDATTSTFKSIVDIAYNESALADVKSLFENHEDDGITSTSKSFSFKEGSLTVIGNKTYKDHFDDDYLVSGTEAIYSRWNNYVLVKNKFSSELKGKRISYDREKTEKITKDSSVQFYAKVSYPDLSDYKLSGSN